MLAGERRNKVPYVHAVPVLWRAENPGAAWEEIYELPSELIRLYRTIRWYILCLITT
jgi:hypothetical protein